uniref:Uncharacterized 3.2 kDa protein in rpoC2-rps2 intergenic region n=1 Tax=Trieres chinensis TaxID=1514140 RepID=YCXD_TRICV|nr:ORF26b [Trieres chinensis]P49839.1 RecName: Full=Uncharacterized 3.2 kDa protein in rpoC2-rps2 intergenic region; AltName: Full=ORF26B [Trieres chinensis]CAA91747.1 ORF26b [Trieres chinensis]
MVLVKTIKKLDGFIECLLMLNYKFLY